MVDEVAHCIWLTYGRPTRTSQGAPRTASDLAPASRRSSTLSWTSSVDEDRYGMGKGLSSHDKASVASVGAPGEPIERSVAPTPVRTIQGATGPRQDCGLETTPVVSGSPPACRPIGSGGAVNAAPASKPRPSGPVQLGHGSVSELTAAAGPVENCLRGSRPPTTPAQGKHDAFGLNRKTEEFIVCTTSFIVQEQRVSLVR